MRPNVCLCATKTGSVPWIWETPKENAKYLPIFLPQCCSIEKLNWSRSQRGPVEISSLISYLFYKAADQMVELAVILSMGLYLMDMYNVIWMLHIRGKKNRVI